MVSLECVDIAASPDDKGFLAYVKLTDFYKIISTAEGAMRTKLFEANVRDYQGQNDVNSAIKQTLSEQDGEDFWAVNNGVTIVASDATSRSNSLRLENPRIVNGLQTSKEIHLHFSTSGADVTDARLLVARVVVPRTSKGRDNIIYSTNSQTKIPAANLRATDPFQADIEEFFLRYDLYYDRRKNYYKNQGKKASQIVGILFLAQAVVSIIKKQPRLARAYPSTLMTKSTDYEAIFSPSRSFETYLCCAEILRQSQSALAAATVSQKSRNNIRFHVALCYAMLKLKRRSAGPALRYDDFKTVDQPMMEKAIDGVERVFVRLNARNPHRTEDQIGKSLAFEQLVVKLVNRLVPSTKKAL